MERKRVFSGVQPTGFLHIGNYLGTLNNWLDYQKDEYENFFCVVDLHSITVPQDPAELKKNIIEIAKIYIAAGIDPEKNVIFVQSHRPEHAELGWIMSCHAYHGELSRMTQFKEKSEGKRETVTAGLFNYPVLMAADIMLYDTDIVPVGDDQKQHMELARDLAQRMNNKYGKMFVVPKPDIRPEGGRIMGLDNPLKKMAKSAESEYSWISLRDTRDIIKKKIQKAVTDTGSDIIYDKKEKPAITNLLNIYSAFSSESIETIVGRYQGKGYGDFKQDLAEIIIEGLAPIQDRLEELDQNPEYVAKVLSDGSQKAGPIASATLLRVKEKLGLG